MNRDVDDKRADYYAQAGSWADEHTQAIYASRKIAWIAALIAATIAVLEALALVFVMPLKTVVPHTLLVDRQTGFVQALDPSQPQKITPQKALTQSFLVQYTEAREGFDITNVQQQFKKVAIWTSGSAKNRYVNLMQASNPQSPLAILPRNTVVDVKVRSVSQLSDNSAMVRFATVQINQGAAENQTQNWVSIIRFRYSTAPMTAEDRYVNPLGFEVTDYRKDAENLPAEIAAPIQQISAPVSARSGQIGTPITPQPAVPPR